MRNLPSYVVTQMERVKRPYLILDRDHHIASANRSVINFFKSKKFDEKSGCENITLCPMLNSNSLESDSCHEQISKCPFFYNYPLDSKRIDDVFENGESYTIENMKLGKEFGNVNIYMMVHKLSSDIAGVLFQESWTFKGFKMYLYEFMMLVVLLTSITSQLCEYKIDQK